MKFLAYQICLLVTSVVQWTTATLNLADVPCGKGNLRRSTRIVNGKPTKEGEFPWQVYIVERVVNASQASSIHVCSGAIIHQRFVLTAAHCVLHKGIEKYLVVIANTHDLTKMPVEGKLLRVKKLIVHPNMTQLPPPEHNDIALLELSKDIKWSNTIRPVCLPDKNTDRRADDLDGHTVTIAGWGRITEDANAKVTQEDTLQKLTVKVLSRSKCQTWYQKELNSTFKLTDSHLCAGSRSGKKGTCLGDSGGSLLLRDRNERFVSIGLVSGAIGCGREKLPTIYTRVSQYSDWITKKVKPSQ